MFPLRIATINLRNRADRWLMRRQLLVAQLVEVQPDVIALQEISLSIGQGRWLQRQLNYRISGNANHPYQLVQERRRHPSMMFEAVGMLTKMPIIYSDAVSLGYQGRVAVRANLQLPTPQTDSRQQSIDVVSVHLHHPAEAADERLEQVMTMVGWLNDRRRVSLQVIAGDFNEVPDGAAITFMKQSYRSAYVEARGREPLATFPTALCQPSPTHATCIDYIFISPAVAAVRQAEIFCDRPDEDDETLYPSDHVGLVATIEV